MLYSVVNDDRRNDDNDDDDDDAFDGDYSKVSQLVTGIIFGYHHRHSQHLHQL